MRVLSVVTLVNPSGAYGGPVRVAVNQARELLRKGHQVIVAGGCSGFDSPPTDLEGVPARLFPARVLLPRTGFAGLSSPGLLRWARVAMKSFDVVHVHLARDLVTLPIAALARRGRHHYLVQTHGMIDPSSHPLAKPLDAALTRRVLGGADAVLYLTQTERAGLLKVAPGLESLVELPNGVPEAAPAVHADRGESAEVLFMARLAPRKRPTAFIEAATQLTAEFPAARFSLVGPDEGEAPAVKAAIAAARRASVTISWEGALSPELTLDRMRRASAYVLPAVNEPYPMSVLEAMSVGLPVVLTDTCGLAPLVRRSGAGLVTDGRAESLVTAIRGLLSDPTEARAMGERGRQVVRSELSMDAIGRQLSTLYSVVTGAS